MEHLAGASAFAGLVFALDRAVPELGPIPDDGGDEHPICAYLWDRFPGW